MQVLLDLYSNLHQEAVEANQLKWSATPKLHLMQELVQFQAAELGNPRGYWKYKDEEFVGWVATLPRRRGGWNTPRVLVDRVLPRYRGLAC